MNRNTLKAMVLPAVAALPAALREPLRAMWRRLPGYDADTHSAAEPPPASDSDPAPETAAATADAVAAPASCAGEATAPAVDIPAQSGETSDTADTAAAPPSYEDRIAQETRIFADQLQVHDLPPIFHYWSNTYLRPMLQAFDCEHPEDFLAHHLFLSARHTGAAVPRFVSLGCGNCDAEIRIAQALVRRGLTDFTFECMDINPAMLERGAVQAHEAGLEGRVLPVQGDFNRWTPEGRYDGIMANQSLHHVLELEALFDAVRAALQPQARFVVSDMIGRNGHQRWPEAAAIVREFWEQLPPSYRYNLQLQRQEDDFLDWDCSVEGFEGVRAQDVLPLLLERFGVEVFLGFGNIIDPFIDRGFGHHFDAGHVFDRHFIDRVHARDEAEMQAGRITPTHMLAVFALQRDIACAHRPGLAPQTSVRDASIGVA